MKIRSLFTTLTLLLLCTTLSVSAQEVVIIGGVKYTIHDVVKGDTLYSLARKYGTTVDDIVAANSALRDGLKAGVRIKIPTKSDIEVTATERTNVKLHKVVKGETLYSLAQQNGLTVEELRTANPLIKKGLKAGQTIEIPLKANTTDATTTQPTPATSIASNNPVVPTTEVVTATGREQAEVAKITPSLFRTLNAGETAEVALLLPLGTEERPSQNYLDFYRGFLIGLDSVRMAGHSVNLNLYNTAHDYNRITEIIASGDLEKTNLVVGPIYEDELIPVAGALEGKGIPIVSPLANLNHTTSNAVFQMSPSPATKLDKVRNMFDGSKRVVIISTDNIDKEFDAEVRSMLKESSKVVEHKYIYEHPSIIEKREKEREKLREKMRETGVVDSLAIENTPSPSDMSPLLRGEEPTVIVITANNEIDVDRILAAIASANIALTARSQRVVPFVIFGNNRWNRYNNIDRAILFTNNVTMLSTYQARRNEQIIRNFDKRFIEEFGALPSLYAYRGYDAAVVFIESLYGEMRSGMEGVRTTPLLTPYSFSYNPTSGIRINSEWIKVKYNSNFTITTN